MNEESSAFDSLKFNPEVLEPPSWAHGPQSQWGHEKMGESSRSTATVREDHDGTHASGRGDDESDEDEVYEDALDGLETSGTEEVNGLVTFTLPEMRVLLGKAVKYKETGNMAFTAKPPNLELAIESYRSALKCLPEVPKPLKTPVSPAVSARGGTGIQEVTEEEATQIEQNEATRREANIPDERRETEADIRDCGKACWGNLAACWIAQKDDAEAVKACTEALKLDPTYVKALQRRASANDRLSTWSSLSSARDDYNLLLTLLEPSSAQIPAIRRSIASLAPRLKLQEEKEKDEMMSKLKDLGNSLLGNFGLSTNNFKFDPQPGGGYSMRFEQ